ncbi:uncharacterized protein V6R79_016152 [Siganus canaliculatus]
MCVDVCSGLCSGDCSYIFCTFCLGLAQSSCSFFGTRQSETSDAKQGAVLRLESCCDESNLSGIITSRQTFLVKQGGSNLPDREEEGDEEEDAGGCECGPFALQTPACLNNPRAGPEALASEKTGVSGQRHSAMTADASTCSAEQPRLEEGRGRGGGVAVK